MIATTPTPNVFKIRPERLLKKTLEPPGKLNVVTVPEEIRPIRHPLEYYSLKSKYNFRSVQLIDVELF